MGSDEDAAAPRTRDRPVRRWLRRVLAVAAAVAAVPLVMVPLYAVVPPVSTLMIRDTLAGRPVERRFVPLDEIAAALQHAVVMSEDGRFCEHGGVDWDAIFAVLEAADEDGPARGASTISMQTAKNLFLWSGRSYLRKAMEIPVALYMDAVWTKRRMLEVYLNVAEWGPGIYGAEAAANRYFGKSAAELTRREAALMAAALPNPMARNPSDPTRRQAAIARIVERRAAQAGAYVGCLSAT